MKISSEKKTPDVCDGRVFWNLDTAHSRLVAVITNEVGDRRDVDNIYAQVQFSHVQPLLIFTMPLQVIPKYFQVPFIRLKFLEQRASVHTYAGRIWNPEEVVEDTMESGQAWSCLVPFLLFE